MKKFSILYIIILSSGLIFAQNWTHIEQSGKFPCARHSHALTALNDSTILLFGGIGVDTSSLYGRKVLNDTWVYHVNTNTWDSIITKGNESPAERCSQAMSYIGVNKAVLWGGTKSIANLVTKDSVAVFKDTWIFNLEDNSWTKQTQQKTLIPTEIRPNSMDYIGEDKVIAVEDYGLIFTYDLSDNVRTMIDPYYTGYPGSYFQPGMCSIGNDKIVFFGGSTYSINNDSDDPYTQSNNLWIYDIKSSKWNHVQPDGGAYPNPRSGMAIRYIGNNIVLLYGGYTGSYYPTNYRDTWIYNIATNIWTELKTETAPTSRTNFAFTGLPNSRKLIVFGGSSSPLGTSNFYNDLWIFDTPASTSVELKERIIQEINLYPNPANDKLLVNCENENIFSIDIYSLSGNSVIVYDNEDIGTGKEFCLPIESLSPGTYILRITGSKGARSAKFEVAR